MVVVVVVIELSKAEERLLAVKVDSSSLRSRRLYLVLLYSAQEHLFSAFLS